MSNIPDLQPVAADTRRLLGVARGKAEIRPPVTSAVWTSDASISYQLNAKCQDFITRYLGRSLTTPNDPNMAQVNRKLLELAFAVSLFRLDVGLSVVSLSWANMWLTVPFLNARLSSCGAYI